MASIVIENLTKTFGTFTAIKQMNATFADGQVTCLLGPSGCGKTTLMRMIVGLEKPTSGRILFDDRDMANLPPRKRNVGMVFQYPVMYQTLSVEENLALPLEQDKSLSSAERARRIDEVLDVLDMRDKRKLFIGDLDAGSRQKVAVGRAVARRSDIVLFDEPTTNVEVHAKLLLIRAFKLVTQRLRQTIVYVTHDQTEAMTLADNVALMKDGKILQYDTPSALYETPATEFAGWFLGNPGMNFPPAELSGATVKTPLSSLPLTASATGLPKGDYRIGVRPEHVDVLVAPRPGSVPAVVRDMNVTIAGRFIVTLDVGGATVKAKTNGRPPVAVGAPAHIGIDPAHVSLYRDGVRVADVTGHAA
ncbi:multiple sugar transport system ATP-binding protein/glycerol transport system ATP-binding protein [Rhizobium sp. RU20A]|uniref:ABC transporter ATP-binding protein n=1 Tax=Rhizobium sp. RU20A TaxID=1907412 RepID=UPI00095401B1|nr:ABC transporter ATP-binding protein [Rhizobium sp. RU20A]SIR32647.1 multiple sugar transport system ATP-binding protein/glycerol transport system ATP-binding protein [Rhizobium sp. RU20A]